MCLSSVYFCFQETNPITIPFTPYEMLENKCPCYCILQVLLSLNFMSILVQFLSLNIVKLPELVFLNIAVFMYKFHNRRLPSVFDTFFTRVNKKHIYNTRSASNLSYALPKVRTNYRIFNLKFKGPKVWNSMSENLKSLSISNFKESVKCNLVKDY